MKVLVLGFSVTAENSGYVERWRSDYGPRDDSLNVQKVAIGGLQPYSIRHLVGSVLDREKPDALIVEIATAIATRTSEGTEAAREDHLHTLLAIFASCKSRKIRCGVLDFPVKGAGPEDWVVQVHDQQCTRYGVPHVSVALDQASLLDVVHPNDRGKTIYAEALHRLIGHMLVQREDFSALGPQREYCAFTIDDLRASGGLQRDFARAGFEARALSIADGATIEIELPRPVIVTGVLALMGPRTGRMLVTLNGQTQTINCYDRHSYYERVGGMPLKPALVTRLTVTQVSGVPENVFLLKGEIDRSARIGALTHILYEMRPN